MKIERAKIVDLTPDPSNVRKHGARNLEAIRSSLERFGQQKPIVVDGEGMVRAGNGTLAAAIELGWESIDIVRSDLDSKALRAFAVADNRAAELAAWTDELGPLLAELVGEDIAASDLGFSDAELARLTGASADEGETPEPPVEPVTKLGDLWTLGDHRLLCGDSTDAASVARLMGKQRAHLMATDPPYLVDYDGGNHPPSRSNKPDSRDKLNTSYVEHLGDSDLYARFLRVALAFILERAPVYQWHAARTHGQVDAAWSANGLLAHQHLVWVKPRPVLLRMHFMWQSEQCFYGWVRGQQPTQARRPPNNTSNVWQVDGESDGIHPTQKPVEIFAHPIRYHTKTGEVCYEPFSGSGTQIAAAEQLDRRCFAMELSPPFVDVAVERWEQLTGGKATREPIG